MGMNWMTAAVSRMHQALGSTSGAGRDSAVLNSPFPTPPRVLVVDDNPSNLWEAREMLECWGITPTLAADGAEAVALARECDFDLILMDLQMPVMNGLEATMKIRVHESDHSCARAPVVAYTSGVLKESLLRDCGMNGVLEKPCSARELRECLLRWCAPTGGANPEAACSAVGPTRSVIQERAMSSVSDSRGCAQPTAAKAK